MVEAAKLPGLRFRDLRRDAMIQPVEFWRRCGNREVHRWVLKWCSCVPGAFRGTTGSARTPVRGSQEEVWSSGQEGSV